ncbi:hypothetical protein LSAT2_015758 [Lamellibrachia satsuma]|nr:hypothetical protein LSAT2_015758 [Lamellibrachia satsuma]
MNFKELQLTAATSNTKFANQLQKEIDEKNEITCNFEQRLNEAHIKRGVLPHPWGQDTPSSSFADSQSTS